MKKSKHNNNHKNNTNSANHQHGYVATIVIGFLVGCGLTSFWQSTQDIVSVDGHNTHQWKWRRLPLHDDKQASSSSLSSSSLSSCQIGVEASSDVAAAFDDEIRSLLETVSESSSWPFALARQARIVYVAVDDDIEDDKSSSSSNNNMNDAAHLLQSQLHIAEDQRKYIGCRMEKLNTSANDDVASSISLPQQPLTALTSILTTTTTTTPLQDDNEEDDGTEACLANEAAPVPRLRQRIFGQVGKRELSAQLLLVGEQVVSHTESDTKKQEESSALLRKHANAFLFMLRDPLNRAVRILRQYEQELLLSKNNQKKKNAPAACFENLERFLHDIHPQQHGNHPPPLSNNRNYPCGIEWATKLLNGGGGGGATPQQPQVILPQFSFQYRHALEKVLNWNHHQHDMHNKNTNNNGKASRAILVVRADHVWYDLARLEALLGGNPEQFLRLSYPETWATNSTFSKPIFTPQQFNGINEEGAEALCCILAQPAPNDESDSNGTMNELQAYQALVTAAVNLLPREKKTILRNLRERCGVEEVAKSWDELVSFEWDTWHARACVSR